MKFTKLKHKKDRTNPQQYEISRKIDEIIQGWNSIDPEQLKSDLAALVPIVETLEAAVDTTTKYYKALISQNAPIASVTSGTVPIGSIWTITTFETGDDFSNWELLSGTANTTGAVYRALTDAPTVWTNESGLSYDGAPFIVSKDADGNFGPFVNDFDTDAVFSRHENEGFGYYFLCTIAGAFPSVYKTSVKLQASNNCNLPVTWYNNVNSVGFNVNDFSSVTPQVRVDGGLYITEFSIEVRP